MTEVSKVKGVDRRPGMLMKSHMVPFSMGWV